MQQIARFSAPRRGSDRRALEPKKSRRRRPPAFRLHQLPSHVILEVCDRFLRQREFSVREIAEKMQRLLPGMRREHVYLLLHEGFRRGFVQFSPPIDQDRQRRLRERFAGAVRDITVVDAVGPTVIDHLARYTAEQVLQNIKEDPDRDEVHIGFGGGRTVQQVARHLTVLLQHEPDVPTLVLHALGTGFATEDPSTSAASFFGLFHDLEEALTIDYRLVPAPPFVPWNQYALLLERRPDLRRALRQSGSIDIVVTTLNNANHEHGLLYSFMQLAGEDALRKLRSAGWIGDVLWRPYSADGPITANIGIRPITMFELDDLVRLAKRPDRHVYLVAGPCPGCANLKTEALRPILMQASLRICNHLVIDTDTAYKLLTS